MTDKVEKAIIAFTAVVCVLIPVFDFIGILDNIPWIAQRIPIMLLLCFGIVAMHILISFRRFDENARTFKDELIQKIRLDEVENSIVSQVKSIWESRESLIQEFFDELKIYSATAYRQPLFEFLNQIFLDFAAGNFFKTKIKRPWDFSIVAIDHKGRFLYHPNHKIVSMLANEKEQVKQILSIRNGSFVWINKGMSEQVGLITDDLLRFRFPRFTKCLRKIKLALTICKGNRMSLNAHQEFG